MAIAVEGRLYTHYKNPIHQYEVVHVITSPNQIPTVIYKQLYTGKEFPRGMIWMRLRSEFEGKVTLPDGQVVDRFNAIDPLLKEVV